MISRDTAASLLTRDHIVIVEHYGLNIQPIRFSDASSIAKMWIEHFQVRCIHPFINQSDKLEYTERRLKIQNI